MDYNNNSNDMNNNNNGVKDSSDNSNDDNNVNNVNNELSNMNIDSSSHRSSDRNCLYCLQVVESSSRCSQCRTALYCNRNCQIKHWPLHKNICINSNNILDNDEKLEMKAMNHSKQGN